MKNAVLFSAIGVLAGSGTIAHAQEIGKVLSSTPVIQQVQVPRQVCSNQVVGGAPTTGGGAVVGGVTGGLLGNAISTGGGGGKAAATALGIVGGALLGNSIEASNNAPRNVQRCTTQTFLENRTVGYNVRYEYAGREYDVQMPYDPGPTIQLQVTPVAANSQPGYGNGTQPQGGVITAPPVHSSGNGPAPIQPVYPPANPAPPVYPASPQVQNTQTPTYLQSPDGYPPAQIIESSTSYYPSYPYYGYPYGSYYGGYPYYYGYPYYGGYWPYFPVALSVGLGFGYWAGGHAYYGHGGGGHYWGGGGHGGWGGAGHGGWGGGHGGGGARH